MTSEFNSGGGVRRDEPETAHDTAESLHVTVSPRMRPLVRKGRANDGGLHRTNPAIGRKANVRCVVVNKDANTTLVPPETPEAA